MLLTDIVVNSPHPSLKYSFTHLLTGRCVTTRNNHTHRGKKYAGDTRPPNPDKTGRGQEQKPVSSRASHTTPTERERDTLVFTTSQLFSPPSAILTFSFTFSLFFSLFFLFPFEPPPLLFSPPFSSLSLSLTWRWHNQPDGQTTKTDRQTDDGDDLGRCAAAATANWHIRNKKNLPIAPQQTPFFSLISTEREKFVKNRENLNRTEQSG